MSPQNSYRTNYIAMPGTSMGAPAGVAAGTANLRAPAAGSEQPRRRVTCDATLLLSVYLALHAALSHSPPDMAARECSSGGMCIMCAPAQVQRERRIIGRPVWLYHSQQPLSQHKGAAGLLITEQQVRSTDDLGVQDSVTGMAQNELEKQSGAVVAAEPEPMRGEVAGAVAEAEAGAEAEAEGEAEAEAGAEGEAEAECGVEEERRAGEGWTAAAVPNFGRVEVEGVGAERALTNQRTCFSVTGGPGKMGAAVRGCDARSS
ncbi:unnamed protein product [Closterium sp. NIES-65]|nr:unnamed protein product [Closterium sp. NIES-65]